ncbi:unnamed protein product [Oikopleura dioica]|uniref:Homeobox domain-containing protein n=1 Tax=Oikopleura dioica TaxID=34765 RepID=E4YLB4_OIKDI|nr:unnamed protein product [Oikopleura dioica]
MIFQIPYFKWMRFQTFTSSSSNGDSQFDSTNSYSDPESSSSGEEETSTLIDVNSQSHSIPFDQENVSLSENYPVMSHFEQMMTPALAQWASEIQSHTTSCDLPLLPVSETELDLASIRSREESQDSLGYNSATSSVLDPSERQRESSLNSVYSDVSTSSVLSMDSLTAKDEETPGLRHRKPFQRVTYSDEQLSSLAIKFEEKRYLTTEERHQLASDIGITDTQVKVWFQNRRAKEKRKRYSKDSGLSLGFNQTTHKT